MTLKIPPPPPMAVKDQALNRWLLEITSILNSTGGIDPASVDGLAATTAQVGTNTTSITTISAQIVTINGQLVTLNTSVTTLNGQVATLNAAVAALQANPVVRFGAGAPAAGLGSVGDWYGDPAGGAGARIWIKTAVATWTPFPF